MFSGPVTGQCKAKTKQSCFTFDIHYHLSRNHHKSRLQRNSQTREFFDYMHNKISIPFFLVLNFPFHSQSFLPLSSQIKLCTSGLNWEKIKRYMFKRLINLLLLPQVTCFTQHQSIRWGEGSDSSPLATAIKLQGSIYSMCL